MDLEKEVTPIIDDLLKKRLDSGKFYGLYSYALKKNGEYEKAIKMFTKAKHRGFATNHLYIYYEFLAECFFDKGDYRKAIKHSTIAIRKCNDCELGLCMLYFLRAKSFSFLKEHHKAYLDAKRASKFRGAKIFCKFYKCHDILDHVKVDKS